MTEIYLILISYLLFSSLGTVLREFQEAQINFMSTPEESNEVWILWDNFVCFWLHDYLAVNSKIYLTKCL